MALLDAARSAPARYASAFAGPSALVMSALLALIYGGSRRFWSDTRSAQAWARWRKASV